MVIRIVLFLASLLACRAADAAETDCRDCQGSGEVSCAACKGSGQTPAPCGECIEGKARCGSGKCKDGQVQCPRCKGTGSYFRGYEVGRIRPGGGGVVEVCRPTVNCPKCKGTAQIACKACRGKGTTLVDCFSCEGRKKERCLPCYGTGKVGDPDPEPPAEPPNAGRSREARVLPGQEADLRDALELLEEAARRAAKLDAEKRAALDGMERLRMRIDALVKRASEEPALRQAAAHLARRWKASHLLVSESAATIEKTLSGALSKEAIAELRLLASDLESGKAVARSVLEDRIASAKRQRKAVMAMGGQISGLLEELRLWDKEVAAFEARLKGYQAAKELGRRKAEEVRGVYLQVGDKIPSLAEKGELPAIDCELLTSRSPDALFVQLTYFDESAAVSESPEDSVPGDEGLAKLPAFVSAVFRECPNVERVRLVVDANGLTETGLEERRTIQRFTMDRGRWKELVSGKYREEWATLLSKSHPAPAYPRPPWIPAGTWPIVALIGVCFLGTAVVLAARARMLS